MGSRQLGDLIMARKTLYRRTTARWTASSFRTKTILTLTAIVVGITGAITGIAASAQIIEPYWYVSQREFRLVVDKQALAIDRQTLFQLQEYLDRARKDPAAATSAIVRDRIRELEQQIEQTGARIRRSTGQ